jgi:iron(III) transport system permease protein
VNVTVRPARFEELTRSLARALLWAAVLLLVAYPLAMVVISIIFAERLGASPITFAEIFSVRIAQAWQNTLWLGLLVTAGSTLFALPLALLAAQTRHYRWLDLLMSIPFLTPPFLVGLAWTLAVGRRGYASRLGLPGEALEAFLFSVAGLALLMAVNYAPIVYFALRAQLARVPSALLWAALAAGQPPFQVVGRVLLPLLVPGLLAGGFLAFASSIGEYGTPLIIGNRIGYPVIATEIARLINVFPINLSLASALGGALLLLGAGAYAASLSLRPRGIPALTRSSYPAPRLLATPALAFLWLLFAIYALIAVLVPFASIVLTSLMKLVSAGPSLGNLGLQNYAELLAAGSTGFRALSTSFSLALFAAAAGTILGLAAARGSGALAFVATIPIAVPAITMAVGFIRGWNAPWVHAVPLYGTAAIVGLYYLAQYLPYSVQYVRAGQAAMAASLEQAAHVHGAGPAATFVRIMVPLLWPHALAGAIMIFSISFRELVGSVLLRPAGIHTSATYILSQFDQGSVSLGMAMGLIVVLASLLSVLSARYLGQAREPSV